MINKNHLRNKHEKCMEFPNPFFLEKHPLLLLCSFRLESHDFLR